MNEQTSKKVQAAIETIQSANEVIEPVLEWFTNRKRHTDPEAEKLRTERAAVEHKCKVNELRSAWNAPKRHLSQPTKFEGEFKINFEGIRNKLLKTGVLIGLVGTRGNGKTQMAVELMKDVTNQKCSAHFLTAVEFFGHIKATYKSRGGDDDAEINIIQRFREPRLLVIDEIGKRSDSEWENNLLFELINKRYNDMKDTLLIDNRTKAEFIATIGPSLASRMNEGGGIIEATWPSFRV